MNHDGDASLHPSLSRHDEVVDTDGTTAQLPDEIWLSILSLCDKSDLISLSLVSRWMACLARDDTLWRAVYKRERVRIPGLAANGVVSNFCLAWFTIYACFATVERLCRGVLARPTRKDYRFRGAKRRAPSEGAQSWFHDPKRHVTTVGQYGAEGRLHGFGIALYWDQSDHIVGRMWGHFERGRLHGRGRWMRYHPGPTPADTMPHEADDAGITQCLCAQCIPPARPYLPAHIRTPNTADTVAAEPLGNLDTLLWYDGRWEDGRPHGSGVGAYGIAYSVVYRGDWLHGEPRGGRGRLCMLPFCFLSDDVVVAGNKYWASQWAAYLLNHAGKRVRTPEHEAIDDIVRERKSTHDMMGVMTLAHRCDLASAPSERDYDTRAKVGTTLFCQYPDAQDGDDECDVDDDDAGSPVLPPTGSTSNVRRAWCHAAFPPTECTCPIAVDRNHCLWIEAMWAVDETRDAGVAESDPTKTDAAPSDHAPSHHTSSASVTPHAHRFRIYSSLARSDAATGHMWFGCTHRCSPTTTMAPLVSDAEADTHAQAHYNQHPDRSARTRHVLYPNGDVLMLRSPLDDTAGELEAHSFRVSPAHPDSTLAGRLFVPRAWRTWVGTFSGKVRSKETPHRKEDDEQAEWLCVPADPTFEDHALFVGHVLSDRGPWSGDALEAFRALVNSVSAPDN